MRNRRCNNICVKLRLYKYSKERAKTLEIKTHKYLEIDDQINNPIIKEIYSMRKIKRKVGSLEIKLLKCVIVQM